MNEDQEIPETDNQKDGEEKPFTIAAEDLFQQAEEIRIMHNGEVYRLRITRRNKLILQK